MGHYASEMDSDWSDSMNKSKRINDLKNTCEGVPLSKFKAEDVILLYKLFHITEFTGLSENEIEQLESRIGL